MSFGPGNYHIYDYRFYYMNIRKNLQDRINEYLRYPEPESGNDGIRLFVAMDALDVDKKLANV